MNGAGTVARKVAIVARVAVTVSAATTLAGALAVETAKVTASAGAIVTMVISPCKATLAIGQTRIVLSVGVAGVKAAVAKTVANVINLWHNDALCNTKG